MLVLSRRPGERVLFPSLGVSIDVLRSRGAVVRLGIEAPKDVKVLRGEIVSDQPLAQNSPDEFQALANNRRFELRSQLNQVTQKLEQLRRQLESGTSIEAETALKDVISDLSQIENLVSDKFTKPEELNGVRVLIVEDRADERELLASCLRLSGMEVDSVGDGAKAIEYLQSHELPDLVLLDMRMPGIDGPTLLNEIRKDEKLNRVRVFAVSGSPRSEFPSTAVAVDGWFSKPVRIDALLHAAKLTRDASNV